MFCTKNSSQCSVDSPIVRIQDRAARLSTESESGSVVLDSLRPRGLYSPWNSLRQNTGVGSLSLLQGIFPTQGSNPGLPHCRWILYQLSQKHILLQLRVYEKEKEH